MIVNVDLYDDGQFVATYAADIVRADLLTYTKSSGAHSFAIPVPEDRKDGRSHNVSIRASGSAYELDLSPVAITWHADDTSADYQTMDLAMSDQLFGRLFDALVYDRCVPVLALVLRTGAFSKPDMTSNCVRNFQYLLNHPMANHFVSATPAEAFKLLCAQRESSVQSRWAVG
jgi:hypothetical protein